MSEQQENNIQNENLEPISAEELAKKEAAENAAAEEKVEDVTDDAVAEEEKPDEAPVDSDAKEEEVAADEEKEDIPSDEGNASDENGDGKVSEDVGEDAGETEEEPVEPEAEVEKEPNEVEVSTNEVDELKKQVEEFQFEKEEREGIVNLQTEVNKGQDEYADFEAKVNAALQDALVDNKIDLNKPLAEIKDEDPAKFKIAMNYIQEAEALKQRKIAEISKKVEDVQNKLIFKRAEREFAKFDLTDDQAQVAADTFIKIMREVGIQDLGEDLKLKVSLAVGQGKLIAKGVKDVAHAAADVMEAVSESAAKVEEKLAEKEEELKAADSIKDVEEPEKKEEKEEVAKEEPAKEEALAEAMDDPTAIQVGADVPNKVDDPEILTKLAQFKQGSKEQLAFYKEHHAEINKAMANYRKGF